MTTLAFSIGDEDVRRIALELASILDRPLRGWMDVKAAAEYVGLTEEAIRTAHKRGRLRGHKGDSGRLLFRVEDLDLFAGAE